MLKGAATTGSRIVASLLTNEKGEDEFKTFDYFHRRRFGSTIPDNQFFVSAFEQAGPSYLSPNSDPRFDRPAVRLFL